MVKKEVKRFIFRLTPTQFIVFCYFSAVVFSTLLLMLPVSQRDGIELSFIDALFTAASAISVTGLTVVNTAETFSVFGSFVMMIIFQFGGIGIMTLGTFLWMVLGRNISLSYRRLIMIDQNQSNLSGLVRLMRIILLLAIFFELIGTLIFGVYFYVRGYFDSWSESFYYGLFHAISSYTNAGFDIFGNSLYRFSGDYFVQTITMALLVLGAIGFPVLVEVREYLFGKHVHFRFSLFTKVTSSMFFLLILLGALGIWLVEGRLYMADMAWHEKLFYSLFNSITTRSGGLATMDVGEFSPASHLLLSVLMFIGASPSSVGGGIRTTTFAVLLLTSVTYAMGRTEIRIFRRSIKQEDIIKSFVVFSVAVIMVVITTMVLVALEGEKHTLTAILFDVCSAFGTSGLSVGVTSDFSAPGKFILVLLMFVGRIGMLNLLFMFRKQQRKLNVHYPKENLIIG